MWIALRQRNVALLWTAGFISVSGDWMIVTALPFFIYQQTRSAFAVSVMFAAYFAPRVLVSSIAGVFVDRWDRKVTLIISDLLRVPLLLTLLLVQDNTQLWIIYVVILVEATIGQFFVPAKSALMPHLVDDAQLAAANALNALNNNVGRLIGSAIAGVVLGWGGLPAVALLDSSTYLLSALLISLITLRTIDLADAPATTSAPTRASSFWHELREGLRLIRGVPVVMTLFAVFGIVNFADSITSVLYIAFVQDMLHVSAAQFGAILAAGALGGMLGGVAVDRLGRTIAPATLISVGALGVGAVFWAMFHLSSVLGVMVLSLLMGFPLLGMNVSGETLLQRTVADAYRGRVLGVFGALVGLVYMLGLTVVSLLTDRIGVLRVLDVGIACYVIAGVVAAIWLRRAHTDRSVA